MLEILSFPTKDIGGILGFYLTIVSGGCTLNEAVPKFCCAVGHLYKSIRSYQLSKKVKTIVVAVAIVG